MEWNYQVEIKQRNKKEYLRRTRKLLETKLYRRNLIKRINTWAIPPCKISGTILEVDQRTRKLMTIHRALHLKDDADRLYVSKKGGGRGVTST